MERKIWIGLTILVILLIGTTYAWWTWNSTTNTDVSLTVDGINVTYDGGPDITGINLIPVSSKEKGIEDNTAILKTVTVSSSQTLYMDLNLTLETLPDGLKDRSFVWELYNGTTKVSNGNFGNVNQGEVIKLLTSQKVTTTTTTYDLYIWIDGNQSNTNSMMNQTFKFILNANGTDEKPPQPNSPDLVEGLVPITYSNNKWVKSDSTNVNNSWYDYANKKWANAALVSSSYRDGSNKDIFNVGDEVPEEAILAYYVWIPRYKYKVWNINKVIGTDSYDAQNKGIDIVFESGTSTTGTIMCNNYSFAAPTETTPNETCSGSNGEYYTHPAFTFGDDELRGVWVGKFEISTSSDSLCHSSTTNTNCLTTNLSVRVKPSSNPWRFNYLSNFSYAIQNMQSGGNEFGLKTDSDTHMIKNMEWGAVAYLTHSDYGRCMSGRCDRVANNSYFESIEIGYKTGCGPQSENDFSSGSICNEYDTELGQTASTTKNVYGIYDMSGGAYDYVMGNMSSTSTNYTYYPSAEGNNFTYSPSTAKYIDTYANGSTNKDQTAYNRSRLGDATGEVVYEAGSSWNGGLALYFNSGSSWLVRGGNYSNTSNSTMFYFEARGWGGSIAHHTTRTSLISLQ